MSQFVSFLFYFVPELVHLSVTLSYNHAGVQMRCPKAVNKLIEPLSVRDGFAILIGGAIGLTWSRS